jgi:ABC-2 type transport system ATP-binding protein
VATVLRHDAGTVRVLGRDPARADDRHDIRCRLGYQPQEPGFYQGFSVTDFLDYVAILKEMADRRARRREVWRVVELVDLGPVARTAIRKLTGGMRRRVALAAALLGAPELLILDEPTTGLDPEQRMRFRQVVADLADECTIVLSTHLTDDVDALCDRVVVLDGGRTRFDGSPTELAALAAGAVGAAGAIGAAPTVMDGYLCLQGQDRDADPDPDTTTPAEVAT